MVSIRVLQYHQVIEQDPPDVHTVRASEFARQMRWLREAGYVSIHLQDCLHKARHRACDKAVAITFDDGYLDFWTTALPVLQREGFGATVFLVASQVGGHRGWDCGFDSSGPPLLTWDQVRGAARSDIRFGSHSMTHPDLTALPPSAIAQELAESRWSIERETGKPAAAFAYPYSRENALVRRLVRESGYELACTYHPWYVGGPGGDAYRVQRIGILATDGLSDFVQKVKPSARRRVGWFLRLLRGWGRREMLRLAGLDGDSSFS